MLVLVGANGFLGRHMCEFLERRGVSGVAVSSTPDRSFFERFAPSLRVMTTGEFASPAGRDVIAKADAVVYFSWRSGPGTFAGEPWRELSENLDPAMRLFLRVADASHRAKIVFLSSGGTVYGLGVQPQSEASATNPISAHGFGKLLTEEALRFVGRLKGTPYAILRISNAVGRWQSNQFQGIASVALRAIRDGKSVKLFGGGLQVRDFVDADDVAEAIYLASVDSNHPAATWNVGSGTGLAIVDLLSRIEKIVGRKIPVDRAGAREIDVPYSVLDCRKIAGELGWSAKIPLEQSISGVWQAIQTG